MTVTRLNHFEAKPDCSDDLRRFLIGVVDVVRRCPGCISCELLESVDDPGKLAVVEVWESVDSHQAAAKAIPIEQLRHAMTLMSVPAAGAYYRTVNS